MDSKKQRSLKDISDRVENVLTQTGACSHSYDYLQSMAYQLQQIYSKIEQSYQSFFNDLGELDEQMQEDIKQYQLLNLNVMKNTLENLSEVYNQRCSLQEETMKNLSNVASLNNQLLGSRSQWNQ